MVSATGSPQTIYTLAIAIVWQYYNFDAIDGPLGPNMADYVWFGCHRWLSLPQAVPCFFQSCMLKIYGGYENKVW